MTVAPSSVLAIFLCLLISGGCGGGERGGAAAQSAWTMPGIVRQATRPASVAQCVEVDGAWMVPYEETIPGTAVRFTMIPVPGGSFRMGSPKDEHGRHDTEGPPFTVEMPPFWIGRCEVTWGEYRTFMAATAIFRAKHGDDPPSTPAEVGVDAVTAPSMLYDPDAVYASVAADRPATGMSQYAARQYTKWISKLTTRFYRIPSECEWEYACRAGAVVGGRRGEHQGGRRVPNAAGVCSERPR